MGAKEKRKKMEKQLAKKMQQSYDNRDDTGMYRNFFNDDLKLPNFVAGKDEYMIDILPWEAGDKDPNTEEGEFTHVLDVWTHGNVGASERTVICPTRTYDEKCPICEKGKKLRELAENDEEEKEAKTYNPVRRVAYQIIVRDGRKEERKGVQLFIIAHFHMEKHLAKLSRNPKGGGFVPFALTTKEGKTICFEREGTGAKSTQYSGYKFADRENDIEKKYLKRVVCLDGYIEQLSYEELHTLFNASKPSDDEDDDNTGNDDDLMEDDDNIEDDGLDELSVKKLKKLYKKEINKSPKGMDEDDMIEAIRDHRNEDDEDDEDEDNDTDNDNSNDDEDKDDGLDTLERPELRKIYKKETGKKVKSNWKDSDIVDKIRESREENEDEDEDDEEPIKTKLKCPAKGGTFGEDIDTLPKCDKCKIYKKCEKKYEEDDDD